MTSTTERSVELLGRLVGFDTTSHRSNLPLIHFVRDHLAALGVDSEIIHDDRGDKAALYATLGPAGRGGVALSGHTDVVPVTGQAWSSDPFTLTERDGRLFGRGAADMKGFIATALAWAPRFAAARLREPVHLCLSYDEEIGCLGVRPLLARLAAREDRPRLVIVGEPTDMRVVTAHKGKRSFDCRVRGRECHSSLTPHGVNAVEYAARIVVHLKRLARDRAALGPFDDGYEVPHTTLHTGVLRGGTALNVVPNAAELQFEIRDLPSEDTDALQAEIETLIRESLVPEMRDVAPEAGIELELHSEIAGFETSSDHEAVRLALALAETEELGKVDYGTEAGLFARAGIPAVVCGPGSIAQAHRPDEYLSIEQLARCDRFMARLVERLSV